MKKQITKTSLIVSVALLGAFTFFSACKVETNNTGNDDGQSIVASQLSDVMASIDEMGGSSGTIHTMASCYGNGFGACTSNTVLRTFSGCTDFVYTLNGTVTLNWGGSTAAACTMNSVGDYITRNPNYSIQGGSRAGLVSIFSDGGLEKLTWTGNGGSKIFSYTNSGTRRTWMSGGRLGYDSTMSTAATVTVMGQNRSGRVINGGSIKIVDNMTGLICTVSPQNVTWADPNCTCATQGSWVGTCNGGGSVFRMDMNGCGNATILVGNYSEGAQLDRCQNM